MRIMVFGTFDDLHPGHRFLLSEAIKRSHDDLTVVVARDTNVVTIKGKAPLQSEEIRAQAIHNAFPSAHVILGNPSGDFLDPIRTHTPDLILLGYDQKLPPGITEEDLQTPTERLPAFEPHIHKSSLRRDKT
jgi:cytidyltransferase-like protein